MILDNYKQFIDEIYQRLSTQGIDTTNLQIDHLGYQAESKTDYDNLLLQIKDIASQVSENIVGGRRVGIFKLNNELEYLSQKISVIEIFEPKEEQQVKSSWEHVEFLVKGTLEEFMSTYPDIDWDTAMLNREEFPMLILKLGNGLRAKFPRRGVLEEVKRQQNIS